MNIRMNAIFLAFFLLAALLTGCVGGLKSETITIPDSAEEDAGLPESQPFAVKTIYRLPLSGEKGIYGWSGPQTLDHVTTIGLAHERFAPPYSESNKLPVLTDASIQADEISPDGGYVSGYSSTREGLSLWIISLADYRKKLVQTVQFSRLGTGRLMWSGTDNYVSYVGTDESGDYIGVYDTKLGTQKRYTIPEWNRSYSIQSVKMSDDGRNVCIMKDENGSSGLLIGSWQGDHFERSYEHRISHDTRPAWLGNNQVAFVGTDDTLFVYDLRNAEINVLHDRVGSFALSNDRKWIAFTTDQVAIKAAKLQGNNVLQEQTIYRGLVPTDMGWSPDGSRLLVTGRKPYETSSSQAAPAVEPQDSGPLIIQFQ
ncbi:PD40 domain-containing protein [Paenibacillus lignilyticus]|uniref:PD40 domain-containing protein n=1 Tax=Paenibacillus lignilyticus TaxID=1172615 RepID=A0ABS5CCI9_9BACL|nr:PD40 domain-containing protein [Paenibacillus lignilyticus]MBP3961614.1 PD40 domain-containing protein [Paenibacillus lignilyticus]MBP3963716.1 PD40 domain-containing protein [Paenibacillus lignilyticus]